MEHNSNEITYRAPSSGEQAPTGTTGPHLVAGLATGSSEHRLGAAAVSRYEDDEPTAEHDPTPAPRIWVGSLADYNRGRLHGAWIDAAQEPDDVHRDIQAMLRGSAFPDEPEEWAILDQEGFGGLSLDEHESIKRVSKIAQGIAEHGPAYGAWAAYVGITCDAELDRFEDHYRGEHASMQAYVEEVLDGIGLHEELDQALRVLPPDLRRYVHVDTEGMARGWETELHVVERAGGGGVWVFEP